MYRAWIGTLVLMFLTATAAWTQESPPGQQRMFMRGQQMRAQIEQRFAERVRQELQLTDDQASQLRAMSERYANRRQELQERERTVRQALADQLQPGLAARSDSVSRLVDDLIDLRVRRAENFRNEMKDLSGFLTPVQRARFLTMRERLFHQVAMMRERQMGAGGRPMRWRRMQQPLPREDSAGPR